MYCPSCGHQIDNDQKFCSNCGADISNIFPPRDRGTLNFASKQYDCPICNESDRTGKVSVLVEAGTLSGLTHTWETDSDGGGYWDLVPFTQKSDLARKLSFPKKPEYSPSSFWWIIVPFLITPYLSGFIGPIAKMMKLIMAVLLVTFLCSFIAVLFTPGALDWPKSENIYASVLYCLTPFAWIFAIFLYYTGLHMENKRRKSYINTVAIPKWEKAKKVWDKLYYCARDDYVFIPSTDISSPAKRIYELINQSIHLTIQR